MDDAGIEGLGLVTPCIAPPPPPLLLLLLLLLLIGGSGRHGEGSDPSVAAGDGKLAPPRNQYT